MQVREPDPDGAFVHRLRIERGVTQEALAFKANVTIATLSRIERGVTAPTVATLRKIAAALDMNLAELVTAVEQDGERCITGVAMLRVERDRT